MKPLIIIPARYGSSRFPGKPLVEFAGQTLIAHTWRAAMKTKLPVLIATDDHRIVAEAEHIGADAIMTGPCANGTERCAEAARLIGHAGPVINWQGDSPLVPAKWIEHLAAKIALGATVVTPVQLCNPDQVERLRHGAMSGQPAGTTVAMNEDFAALYFSKAVIPSRGPVWLHVGIYGYSAQALADYGRREGALEQSEQLEQLRFLERGIGIECCPVEGPPIWEVNNPGDQHIVAGLMGARA